MTVCNPATITSDPQSVTITSGSSTTLSATASGTPPLSYQWFAGTTPINGATGSALTVSPATTTTYFVRITNSCGSDDSAPATVTVCNPATITKHPQSTTIARGASTTLSATASGTAPLSYQWFAGTSAISGATSSSITVSPTATATYFVRVFNGCGAVDSATATVTVAAADGASSLYVITPCRLVDTRGGTAVGGAQTRTVQVTGACAIPVGAKAVVANVTAVLPAGQGFLVLHAAGTSLPGTFNLSYRPAKTRANSSIVALGTNGAVNVYNDGSTAVHFIIDVTGYFQ
ncbi:MAG TPA: immunoglobulin domain-containing protein [Thermoanaerobaculia bacterium]